MNLAGRSRLPGFAAWSSDTTTRSHAGGIACFCGVTRVGVRRRAGRSGRARISGVGRVRIRPSPRQPNVEECNSQGGRTARCEGRPPRHARLASRALSLSVPQQASWRRLRYHPRESGAGLLMTPASGHPPAASPLPLPDHSSVPTTHANICSEGALRVLHGEHF
jgi:hypothetical protein